MIHPRWSTPLDVTKRLVGAVVVMLNTILLLTPLPLSNVVPALVIALISLAYLEEDGAFALYRPAGGHSRADGRVRSGLGDGSRREMDHRPVSVRRRVPRDAFPF